jgi:GT2 family glycosyltransferase
MAGIFLIMDDAIYNQWIEDFDTLTSADGAALEQEMLALPNKPHIAVVPLTGSALSDRELTAFAEGLAGQIYHDWRICLPHGPDRAERPSSENAAATLSAGWLAEAARVADFVLPLPLDVVLPRHALASFVLALAQIPDADILYADEDVLQNGKRSQPQFKTDWDPFFILGCNSIGFPTLYRSEALHRADVWDLTSTTVDNLLHAVTLRVSETTSANRILHIPSVLCHRTKTSDWSGTESRKLVSGQLVKAGPHSPNFSPIPSAPQWNRVRFPLPNPPPLVSVIVLTRDRADLLGPCIDGILNQTNYPSRELVIVDNGTVAPDALAVLNALECDPRVQVLRDDRTFNYSQLNNAAAKAAKGDILVLLNNDMKVLQPDWLTDLVSLAARPDVGAVGAKLLYPDLRVQHAGMSLGPDKAISHQMRLAARDDPGPRGELVLLRSVSALTGACLALRKNLYLEVGGLDEEHLKIAYNDIDLCRRLAKKGLAILWTPFAELIHHESESRGMPTTPEKAADVASEGIAFWSMNPEFYECPDPFHNPQIEFKYTSVDFARPPRWHRFRFGSKEGRAVPFLY